MKKQLLLCTLTGVLLLTVTACGAKTSAGTTTAMGTAAGMGTESEMGTADGMGMESEMGTDAGMGAETKTGETMNQGNPAPDFEMADLKGNKVKLSDFKGRKVYIKYWASWCPICLGGLEDINTLSAEDNGFQVLTVVAPGQKGEKSMEDFKKWFSGVDNTNNITVLFDTDGAYGAKTGVRGYPTSEYIGSDGVMVKVVPGHADNDTIIDTFKTIK